MNKRLQNTIFIVGIIAIIPFLILCCYVYPINDDYSFALRDGALDPFTATLQTYRHWSGRYFATFISNCNPLVSFKDYLTAFSIYSIGLILLSITTVFSALRILLKHTLTITETAFLTTLLSLAFIAQCPRVSEAFYWFSSYTAYTIPTLLSILFFATLNKEGKGYTAMQAILAVCIVGGNEVLAVLFAGSLFMWAHFTNWKNRSRAIILCTVTLICLLIVMLSPGNGQRMQQQLSETPYLWSVAVSLFQTAGWLVLWIPTLLLFTFIYIPTIGIRVARKCNYDFNVKLVDYILIALVVIFLAHIPPTLGLSSVMIGRTANVLYVFFIAYYFFGVHVFILPHLGAIDIWYKRKITKVITSLSAIVLIFVVLFNINGNIATAWIDLAGGKAKAYSEQMNSRDLTIQLHTHLSDTTTLYLEPLVDVPSTIYVSDLNSSPDFCLSYGAFWHYKGQVLVKETDRIYTSNYQTLFRLGKELRK